MIVKKALFCSLLFFTSSLVFGKSVIDMTDSAQREYNLLIQIENNLLSKSIVKNRVNIKSELKKLRFGLLVHCSELFSEGSIAHFEQLSCLNAYNTSLIKTLNDRFKFYPSECPFLVAPIKHEEVFNYADISKEICQEKPAVVCKNNVIKRLDIDLNSHDSCLPEWLQKLKNEYLYIIKEKSYLFSKPNKKTKMYLIKGDKVTILDEKTDDSGEKWYFINYKGTKDLNMWIKEQAVDIPQAEDLPEQQKTEPQTQSKNTESRVVSNTKTAAVEEKIPTSNATQVEEIKSKEKVTPLSAQQESSGGGSLSLSLLASLLGLFAFRLS